MNAKTPGPKGGPESAEGRDRDGPVSFREVTETSARAPAQTYRRLVLGRPTLGAWLRYEMLIGALAYWPGAGGLFLRRRLYPFLFRACGRGAVFGCGLTLRQPDRVALGAGVMLDDFAAVQVRGDDRAGIELGDRVLVGRGSVLSVRDGRIRVEDEVSIGGLCRLAAERGELRIGRQCLVAGYCYLGGGGHRFDRTDIPIAHQGNESRGGTVIEGDCWIGAGSIVLDGARIGRGSVIGAGSLVVGEIPPYSVAVGRPARVRRSRRTEPPPAGAGASA